MDLIDKHEQLARRIQQDIREGRFPDGRLPREVDLVQSLGVSRRMVNRALTLLAERGVLTRIKRKGTFVAGFERPVELSGQVGVMLPRQEHFFGPLGDAIVRELTRRGLFAVALESPSHGMQPAELDRSVTAVRHLLSSPVRGVLYYAGDYSRPTVLDRRRGIVSVALVSYVADAPPPGSAVLTDFGAAAYIATCHLLAKGHRRVAALSYLPGEFERMPPAAQDRTPPVAFRKGYLRAMRGAGLAAEAELIEARRGFEEGKELVRKALGRSRRPTGLVCIADNRAAGAMRVAYEMGIKLPEELAVVGLYNTPWCEETLVPLTSVSLEEDQIARKAVELIASGRPGRRTITVKPKLVVRDSCGGRLGTRRKT